MTASNIQEQPHAFVFELAKALYTPQAPPQPHAEPLQFDAANVGDQQSDAEVDCIFSGIDFGCHGNLSPPLQGVSDSSLRFHRDVQIDYGQIGL